MLLLHLNFPFFTKPKELIMSIKVTLDRIEPQPDESYWVWLSFGVPKKYKDMDEIKNYALDQAKTELQRCIDAL
jgi:hypothetical protein